MSSTTNTTETATADVSVARADLKLEVVVIPVADPDRSKVFYAGLGWRLDADFAFDNGFHVVQGHASRLQRLCAGGLGDHRGSSPLRGGVSDRLRHQRCAGRAGRLGVEISEVFHPGAPGAQFAADAAGRLDGADPGGASYGSFATFRDPDGNGWLLQEVTERAPGRIERADTAFSSVADLAHAMRRASVAHGEHEKRQGGEYDVNSPDWYASYMVAEQVGTELPT